MSTLSIGFASALALCAFSLPPPSHTPSQEPDDPGYVLHEWGTFTTLSDANGAVLEGLVQDDHRLPRFVHRRSALPQGFAGERAKMETPVIYFYSDRPRDLRVSVGFQQGIMTQWYPQVAELVPAVGEESVLRGGILDWRRVRVLGPGEGLDGLPAVGDAGHWEHAREVDANVIASGPFLGRDSSGGERERFLFYRGYGELCLPLVARIDELGEMVIHNAEEEIDGVIVLERRGPLLRGQRLPGLHRGAEHRLDIGALPRVELEVLIDTTRALLVEQGLYPKEARAMVETWRESYFETDGLRVLYPLSRSRTDWILPLSVQPAPRECVRVMIGRTDVLTPQELREAIAALPGIATVEEARARLGRFAVPIVRCLTRREEVGAHARELLTLLERSHWTR